MALFLTEQDVTQLLNMPLALDAVEEVLINQANGFGTNRNRYRVTSSSSQLNVMAAGDRKLGVFGTKTYTVSKKGARFLVTLFDAENGDLLAVMEADRLGQMRTGAASGVATKYLARDDADTIGIYGTGWQAESQLLAVCAVRAISSIKAYSRNAERRVAFARKMTSLLRVDVEAVDHPELAARDRSIIITATTAREVVLKGEWISPGTHINVIGGNFLSKAEIDVETVKRANLIAVDSVEQCRDEAGDLIPAIERGIITWESLIELGRIVAGQVSGRNHREEITLFKSNGIALEDIAAGIRIFRLACERGIGTEVPIWKQS